MGKIMKFLVVIPARLKSKRLPNKPLININGLPMIVRTYKQCSKATDPKNIIVACDSKKIADICKIHKIKYLMTSSKCLTGTDRVYEVSKKVLAENYINVQGDEPIFNPMDLKKIIRFILKKKNNKFVLLGYSNFNSKKIMQNPNIPKIVFNKNYELIYASRAGIPSTKSQNNYKGFRQILVYNFPKEIFKSFKKLKNDKKFLEKNEDIEILRFIENGYKVKLIKLSDKSKSVDTKDDMRKVAKIIKV